MSTWQFAKNECRISLSYVTMNCFTLIKVGRILPKARGCMSIICFQIQSTSSTKFNIIITLRNIVPRIRWGRLKGMQKNISEKVYIFYNIRWYDFKKLLEICVTTSQQPQDQTEPECYYIS